MSVLWLLAGVIIVSVAFLDALLTTLWVGEGAGPLSSRLTMWMWHSWLGIVGLRHRVLAVAGPVILIVTVIMWVLLLWLGWVLIFMAGDQAVLSSSSAEPADWIARAYFAGYTIFTQGNGDYAPNGGGWQIATVLMNASGILLVTLSITYVLSVVGAVVSKRAFANQVRSLGTSAGEVMQNAWDGSSFQGFDLILVALSSKLSTLAEQHLAYPILHYYHDSNRDKSSAEAVIVLHESLTLLRCGVAEHARPSTAVLHSVGSAIDTYLSVLSSASVSSPPESPPFPSLQALQQAQIPTVDVAQFERCAQERNERRSKLLQLAHSSGWEWPSE